MATTKVQACPKGCKNPAQDKMYGQGNRLFNFAPGKGQKQYTNRWRCTCCSFLQGS